MRSLFSVILRFYIIAFTLLFTQYSVADEIRSINVMRGFSTPLKLSEDAGTIAIGDPNLIGVVTIKPNLLMINGQDTGATSLTVFGKTGAIYQYRIQITNDIGQLKALISSVEKKVTVEDINGTVVLKGEVPTAAALARILSIADRFMGGIEEPDFTVISDKGGVLAGNLDEKEKQKQVILTTINQTLESGGGKTSSGRNNRGGGSGIATSLNETLMNNKGNLAQNISRAGVIMAAKGRVMSLIKVLSQPKVEIQMRIVAVDRKKTDEFGIDWRLDGNRVSVGSKLGGVVGVLPSASNALYGKAGEVIDTGTASLAGFFNPGSYFLSTFLRAVEEKGAAKTLSEPLVTAISGEAASFLVGGSVPIPVQQLSAGNATSNAVVITNVQFIEFGLRLVVRPTVLENGKISIVLDQSISQPDYSNAIQILGAPIPSFTQKTVSTITESDSGETWAVAGLLSEEDRKNLKSVPWISKVPIIGWLFKNKDDSTNRNELMILVNARRIDGVNNTTTSFDGVGELSQSQIRPEAIDSELIIDQKQMPVEEIKPSKSKAKFSNKKKQAHYEAEQPNLINNNSTRISAPIKASPVNSSNEPTIWNSNLENIATQINSADKTSFEYSLPTQLLQESKIVHVEVWNFLIGDEKKQLLKKARLQGSALIPPEDEWRKLRIATGATESNQTQEITFLIPPEMGKIHSGAKTMVKISSGNELNIALNSLFHERNIQNNLAHNTAKYF